MGSTQNTVFVLGAGFSFEQGYPLARDLRKHVISFLESKRNTKRGFLEPWNGGYQKGQFYEGLQMVEGDNELPFEELLIKLKERIKAGDDGPFHITNDQIRIGVRRVLWEIHNSNQVVGPAYKNFAERLRLNQNKNGIISFNWDLQAERLLSETGVPWGYCPVDHGRLPVVKPHGSINWNSYRRQGYVADYGGWTPVCDTKLSYDGANPLLDPQLDDVIPQLSHMLYPGDSDLPESDDDLEPLWRDAASLLDGAEEVVFIGYSFPSYDERSRCFFTNKVKNKTVIAINPSLDDLQKIQSILGRVAAQIDLCRQPFGNVSIRNRTLTHSLPKAVLVGRRELPRLNGPGPRPEDRGYRDHFGSAPRRASRPRQRGSPDGQNAGPRLSEPWQGFVVVVWRNQLVIAQPLDEDESGRERAYYSRAPCSDWGLTGVQPP